MLNVAMPFVIFEKYTLLFTVNVRLPVTLDVKLITTVSSP